MTERAILRFTAGERVFHWVYFVSFLVLAATGAFLYLPARPFSMGEAGETSRLIHRLSALVFLAIPLLTLIFSPRGFLRDLREGLTWRGEDARSLRVLLTRYYWTGDPAGLPPQGKFTAGQKLNIGMQIVAFLAFAASGIAIWFGPGVLSRQALLLCLIVHDVTAVLATCFALVHIYMVTILPMTRGAIATMFTGAMPDEYAREHHPRWYAEAERAREARVKARG